MGLFRGNMPEIVKLNVFNLQYFNIYIKKKIHTWDTELWDQTFQTKDDFASRK